MAAEAEADGGYDGKVRTDIDHKTYLPPSWRVYDYLDRDDLEASLDDLCTHKLAFTKNTGRVDNMERNMTDNVDDYVVVRGGRSSWADEGIEACTWLTGLDSNLWRGYIGVVLKTSYKITRIHCPSMLMSEPEMNISIPAVRSIAREGQGQIFQGRAR